MPMLRKKDTSRVSNSSEEHTWKRKEHVQHDWDIPILFARTKLLPMPTMMPASLLELLGMSDNISFNLANQGYNVTKYVPYAKVKDFIPYLIRRAEENTSVAGQTGRELNMLSAEMERRRKQK